MMPKGGGGSKISKNDDIFYERPLGLKMTTVVYFDKQQKIKC